MFYIGYKRLIMKKLITIILLFFTLTGWGQLTNDLSAYYKFEETSGTDVTSEVNESTLNSVMYIGTTINQTGKIGQCFTYTTSTDNVVMSDVSLLQMGASDNAMSCWVYLTTVTNSEGGYALTIVGGEVGAAIFYVEPSTGKLCLGSRNVYSISSDLAVTINEWHHVGYSYDQTANQVTFFLDGTTDVKGYTTEFISGASSSMIGEIPGITSSDLVGKIDELAIWKRKLSTKEILSLYNSGSGLTYPFTTNYTPIANRHVWPTKDGVKRIPTSAGYPVYFKDKELSQPTVSTNLYTMYDGVCPSGSSMYDDYDCAQNVFTSWYDHPIKTVEDYSSVVYIDPDYTGLGFGTITEPYSSWFDIEPWESNTAYLQKVGTTFSTNVMLEIGLSMDRPTNVLIGAYGTGPRPIIQGTTDIARIVNVWGTYVQINGIEIIGNGPNVIGEIGISFRGSSSWGMVYNCKIHDLGIGVQSYESVKYVADTIYNCYNDGIWQSQFEYSEISHCFIDTINLAFNTSRDQLISSGDNIQTNNWWQGLWVHDCFLSKKLDGNKATIMLTNEKFDDSYPDIEKCLIERNHFIGPGRYTGDNGGVTINYTTEPQNIIIRYNLFEGSTGDQDRGIGIYTANTDQDSVYGNVFHNFNIAITGDADNDVFSHNTFSNNATNIGGGSGQFYNNIFDGGITMTSSRTEANNMFTGSVPSGWGNSFQGDADFVNAAAGDFHLQSTSDAIGAGVPLTYYKFDQDRVLEDTTPDVGCFKYIP